MKTVISRWELNSAANFSTEVADVFQIEEAVAETEEVEGEEEIGIETAEGTDHLL